MVTVCEEWGYYVDGPALPIAMSQLVRAPPLCGEASRFSKEVGALFVETNAHILVRRSF